MPRDCELNDFDCGEIIGLWKAGQSSREIPRPFTITS